jgi:hypothetical protein
MEHPAAVVELVKERDRRKEDLEQPAAPPLINCFFSSPCSMRESLSYGN